MQRGGCDAPPNAGVYKRAEFSALISGPVVGGFGVKGIKYKSHKTA